MDWEEVKKSPNFKSFERCLRTFRTSNFQSSFHRATENKESDDIKTFPIKNLENLKEFLKEVFKCPTCNGTGRVKNPLFEACLDPTHPYHGKECNEKCPSYKYCSEGEIIQCSTCNGTGCRLLTWQELYSLLIENCYKRLEQLFEALIDDGFVILCKKDGWLFLKEVDV